MRQIVKILLIFLTVLSISGCSQKIVYVPQKCIVKDVEDPIIDTSKKDNIFDASKQCAKNYMKTKEAFEKLKANVKVCQ